MLKAIDQLKEGDFFQLRGGQKPYRFIAFCGKENLSKGMAFMKDKDGKEWHRKMFPFTKIVYYPEMKSF